MEAGRIARGESGPLSVGYTPTATYEVMPRTLRRFRARWPDVRLELVEHVLASEHFLAALPRRHPLAAKKRIRLRDLDGEACVAVRPTVEPAWATACDEALARAGVRLDVVQETDTKIAMLGLVAAGIGAAIVSASMRRLVREGVVYREIADLGLRAPLVGILGPKPSARATALLALALAR